MAAQRMFLAQLWQPRRGTADRLDAEFAIPVPPKVRFVDRYTERRVDDHTHHVPGQPRPIGPWTQQHGQATCPAEGSTGMYWVLRELVVYRPGRVPGERS